MLTVRTEELEHPAAFDLGATWHWGDQPEIRALAQEVGVESFAETDEGTALSEDIIGVPPFPAEVAPEPGERLRFSGGAQQLCERLAERIPDDAIRLSTSARAITAGIDETVTITVERRGAEPTDLPADFVVLAMPPRLVLEAIRFKPALPDDVTRVMNLTPTWMANTIKCVAVYDRPFWRDKGFSGTVFSTLGPLREIHDATGHEGAGLWAFFSGEDKYREMGPGERAEAAFPQLERIFGPEAAEPLQYYERDWSSDPNTNDEVFWTDEPLLAVGDAALTRPLLDGRLFLAGTETVTEAEGGRHMEGAVRSGLRVANQIVSSQGSWVSR
jgi:monoamine oxidase